jgi:hypothetical protein
MNSDGAADRLIVQWNLLLPISGSPSPVTFQAILGLNTDSTPGDITLLYPDIDTGNPVNTEGAVATVGIKDSTGASGQRLLLSYRGSAPDLVATGKALKLHWTENTDPLADAGPAGGGHYTVAGGAGVELDGSASSDAEQPASTLDYAWDFDGDSIFGEMSWNGATNGDEVGVHPFYRATGINGPTSRTVSLRVTDLSGSGATDTAVIDITPNQPPVADAGPTGGGTYNVVLGGTVQLDASGTSDPDESPFALTYEWDFDGDGLFGEYGWNGGANGDEVGIAPFYHATVAGGATSFTVTLHVTDAAGNPSTDQATIDVGPNTPPTADAGPFGGGHYSVVGGQYLYLDASGTSDPDDFPWALTYQWDFDGDGAYNDGFGQFVFFSAYGLSGGSRTVSLLVTDSAGNTSTDTATIDILPNQSPTAEAGGPYSVVGGQSVPVDAFGTTDPDDFPWTLNYLWDLDGDGNYGEYWGFGGDNGNEVGQFTYFMASGINGPATRTIGLQVTDPAGNVSTDTATVNVTPNQSPVPNPGGPYTVQEAGVVPLDGFSGTFDPDDPFYTLSFAWDLDGDGVFGESSSNGGLPANGEETGTNPLFVAAGLDGPVDHAVSLRVTDPAGNVATASTIVHVANAAPQIGAALSVTPSSIDEGGSVTVSGTAYDVEAHNVSIDWGDGSAPTVIHSAAATWPGEVYGGHAYVAIGQGGLSWATAEAMARQMGGHLVTINDAAENAFVVDFVHRQFGEDRVVWTGFTDDPAYGGHEAGNTSFYPYPPDGIRGEGWVWTSGEPVTYQNWAPGQPDNWPGRPSQNFGTTNFNTGAFGPGTWDDSSELDLSRGAVIELPTAALPGAFSAQHTYVEGVGGAGSHYQITVTATDDDGGTSVAVPDGSGGAAFVWSASNGGNGHAYRRSSPELTFEQAEAEAVALGGHLVSLTSAQEQDFVLNNFLSGAQQFDTYWIGLTDADSYTTEGTFVWTSGEPVGYTNWAPFEPNDNFPGEDYGAINWFHHIGNLSLPVAWNDLANQGAFDLYYRGIIELDAAPAFAVTVKNVAPTVGTVTTNSPLDGGAKGGNPKAEGQAVSISAAFTDPGLLDTHTGTIAWGDGSVTPASVAETLSTGKGTAAGTHAYAQGGVYTVSLTVNDDDGGSNIRTVQVYVTGARVTADGVLQVVGGKSDDNVTVDRLANGSVKVSAAFLPGGSRTFTSAASIQRVLVLLGGGDDNLTIGSGLTVPTVVDGGSGDDRLNAGGGPAVLIGGAGDDRLSGAAARDVLIGGRGKDQLTGNGGDDVLVAGTTQSDADPAALFAILAEWARPDAPYLARIDHLTGATPGGFNGGALFNSSTVFDDGEADVLTGNAGSDWFLFDRAGRNRIADAATGETSTQVTSN